MCLTSESPLAAPRVTARQEGGGQAREPLAEGAVVTSTSGGVGGRGLLVKERVPVGLRNGGQAAEEGSGLRSSVCSVQNRKTGGIFPLN